MLYPLELCRAKGNDSTSTYAVSTHALARFPARAKLFCIYDFQF